MADLSYLEKRQLEKLFDMGGGYVLNFSDRTFREFIIDAVRRDIDDPKYRYASCSKANRLRRFWEVETPQVVGALIQAMSDLAKAEGDPDEDLVKFAWRTAARLQAEAPVPELDAIQPLTDDRTFEALAKSVRDAIENNEPEHGLDRLHTFVVKYIRAICTEHGLTVHKDKPVHSSLGEYVKFLRGAGLLESEMTERILKSSISTIEAFNHVRNNQSFAHDNSLLNYEESLLIYNHVCASIRFLQSIETQLQNQAEAATAFDSDEIPF
jgi:hypothetical protein